MGNPDAPMGLMPIGHISGSPWNGVVRQCSVSVLNSGAIFPGDPVQLETAAANKDATARYPTVHRLASVAAAQLFFGVVVFPEPTRTDLYKQYLETLTAGYVYVCCDPTVVYRVRDDGEAVPTSLWPGQNALLADDNAGSTITGLSGVELDATNVADTNTYALHILNLSDIEDNELGINALWDVMLAMSRLQPTGDATGILGVTPA